MQRLGFFRGRAKIPADFDTMYAEEIERDVLRQEVKLLLDTHLLLWATVEPELLSPQAQAAIDDPANELLFQRSQLMGDGD